MIKHVFLGAAWKSMIEADRWYYRFHSKETLRFVGPWLRRYETYRAYEPPPEAERFGVRNGRLGELWYDSLEAWIEAAPNSRPYTPPPPAAVANRTPGARTMVPARPTEDFLGKEPTPEEVTILRWYCVFKYPDGVPLEEGEKWYLEVHSQEVKQQPGLLKYVSHRTVEQPPFPIPWHRVSELWYEDFAAWRKAVIDSPPRYTLPPWGKEEPFVDMVSIFVGYKPTVDFLRDKPTIP